MTDNLSRSFTSISTNSLLDINQIMRDNNGYSFIVEKNKKPELKAKLKSKNKKPADSICENFFFNPDSSLTEGRE